MRADIHDGQEHERSIHGPDTEAQEAPRKPDALYIPCGGWGSMHNIELLERDLDTMVITWANAMIWSAMKLGKVNAQIGVFGRLLASIS